MKYWFFVPDYDQTRDDVQPVVKKVFINGEFVDSDNFTSDVETAAEVAAEYWQPGTEWYEGEKVFALVDENNNVTNVSVEIEYAPTFTGRTVRQK